MMTAAAITPAPLRLPQLRAAHGTSAWWDVAFLFGALFAITLCFYLIDERTLHGMSVWAKPLKFQASLGIHFATLALLAHLLPRSRREGRAFRGVVLTSAGAALFEIAYIMLQAARARPSHFNDQTVIEIIMYALMGIGSLLLVLAPLAMGLWLWRDQGSALRRDPLRLGAALGLMLSAVCTLIVAGYMSNQGAHWVGDVETDASGLPIVGWVQQGGDLRVSHFFATHAMQVLPLAAFLLRNAGARGCHWLVFGSGIYVLFTGAVFVQALLGEPFLRLNG